MKKHVSFEDKKTINMFIEKVMKEGYTEQEARIIVAGWIEKAQNEDEK